MKHDRALRPTDFSNYIGQAHIIDNLRVFVASAKKRNAPVDHILISGPSGLGKTSLANALSCEIGATLHTINAATIQNKGDLISAIASLGNKDILFIDEIHALNPKIEEILYTAMEDFKLDIIANGETICIELEPFTLVGATTVPGKISKPLLDRFGEILQMEPYSDHDMATIISHNMEKLELTISQDASLELAKRCKGTPRIANRLIRRIQDFALAYSFTNIDQEIVGRVCEHLGIDELGLDKNSRHYLRLLRNMNKPVGLNTISASINIDSDTIESVIEPFLIHSGFVNKISSGRVITKSGINHVEKYN